MKLLLWNWKLQDHHFPDTHERVLMQYVDLNQLRSVKIRDNQYAPLAEFQRLLKNREVGSGYRFTLGLVSWLSYTLFPDRVFGCMPVPFLVGGDHFNPLTNTIRVFSSDLPVLLHEAGHAKDYVRHEWKGTSFILLRLLPGFDLIQEATASTDAIRYLYWLSR